MESAMGTATTLTTPQDQVEALMMEVAEESGLEIMDQLQDLKAPSTSVRESAEAKKEDDLSRRYCTMVVWKKCYSKSPENLTH